MFNRPQRRKTIRDEGLNPKNVKQWEDEFLKLPRIIQAFIIAFHKGQKVPINVVEEAKTTWPQYWNAEGNFEPIKYK